MLRTENIPKLFMGDSVATAAYIRHRVTSQRIPKNTTPYEIWHRSKPDLEYLRNIGSKWWYKQPVTKLQKLNDRANPGISLGYFRRHPEYKLFNPAAQKAIMSRDVNFGEEGRDVFFEETSEPVVEVMLPAIPLAEHNTSDLKETEFEQGCNPQPSDSSLHLRYQAPELSEIGDVEEATVRRSGSLKILWESVENACEHLK